MFTSIIFLIAYVVTGQAITDLNVIVVTSERTVSDFIAANSNFTYISLNAECNKSIAVMSLHTLLNASSVIVDASCFDVSQELVHISFYESIVMISATAEHIYDYTQQFNIVPGGGAVADALVAILKEYNWTTALIINEVSEKYLKRSFELVQKLNSSEINTSSIIVHNFATVMTTVFTRNSHILVVNGGQNFTLNLLCQSYELQKYYPNYEWILLEWYGYQWWSKYSHLSCNKSMLDTMFNYSLTLFPIADFELKSDMELFNTLGTYSLDALSIFSMAYSNCIQFQSDNQYCYDHLESFIKNISFKGLSGTIQFNEYGNRVKNSTAVIQYRQTALNTSVVVAGYVEQFSFIRTNMSTWPDGIPSDGTPITVVVDSLSLVVIVVNSVYIAIEVSTIFICLMFNIILRNKRIVKLTSPTLNYIMIFGAAMMTISAIPLQFKYAVVQLINCTIINRVIPVVGYDICFGIVLVKTWRIYRIFKGDSVGGKALKDWKLVLVVLSIGVFDCLVTLPISIAAIAFSDATLVLDTSKEPTRNEKDVLENYYLIACNTSVFTILLIGFTVVLKIVLHIAGFILAFLTRNVEINVLNDFKSTTIIIYFATVLQFAVYIAIPLTMSNENLVTVIWGTLVFLMVIMFLAFTFIPKMIAVYKDPEGEHVFKQQYIPSSTNVSAALPTLTTVTKNPTVTT